MIRKLAVTLLVLAATLLVGAGVIAQGGSETFPTDNDVNAVAKKLYCPVCPNTPLDVCETLACQDWRAQIRDQLAAGWSEQEIIDSFVAQYGERVLAEPQRRGFTSLVWFLPVLVVLIGLAIVMQVLKTWKAGHLPHPPPSTVVPEVSPETLARVEKEMRELW